MIQFYNHHYSTLTKINSSLAIGRTLLSSILLYVEFYRSPNHCQVGWSCLFESIRYSFFEEFLLRFGPCWYSWSHLYILWEVHFQS